MSKGLPIYHFWMPSNIQQSQKKKCILNTTRVLWTLIDKIPPAPHGMVKQKHWFIHRIIESRIWSTGWWKFETNLGTRHLVWIPSSLLVMLPHFSKSPPKHIIFKVLWRKIIPSVALKLPKQFTGCGQVPCASTRWSSTTFDPARFPLLSLGTHGMSRFAGGTSSIWKLVSFFGGMSGCCFGRCYAI